MARFSRELAIDPPYESDLKGILSFRYFWDAEHTLQRLQDLRQKYLAEGDDKGLEYCRQIALLGRKRAELVSRNRKVAAARREQKKEIGLWFRIWLETPDLFNDWLQLRKRSRSFIELLESEGKGRRDEGERRDGQKG
jgi:hypothetical protein